MRKIEKIEKYQRTSKDTLNKNREKGRMKSMLKYKSEQGITLVALVITVIIIIILATVAINFAFGNNGLITRAEQARDFYANDTKYTEESMSNVESYLEGMLPGGSGDEPEDPDVPPTPTTPTTVADAIPGEGEEAYVFTDTTPIKDDLDNTVYIPGGFHLAEDSGTKVEEGIVIEDSINGNQFVWIPTGEYSVSTSINAAGKLTNELSRRQWGTTANTVQEPELLTGNEVADGYDGAYYYGEGDSRSCTVSGETNSINAFLASAKPVSEGGKGGFYIGRYEAGTETERTSSGAALTTPLVQANKYPYVYITRDNAKAQAEAMYSGNSYVVSELISSYAWDTALNFICQTNEDGYKLATTTDTQYGNFSGGRRKAKYRRI